MVKILATSKEILCTWLKYLPPLGKSSASLGKGCVGSTWRTMERHGVQLVMQGLHSEGEATECGLTDFIWRKRWIKKLDAWAASKQLRKVPSWNFLFLRLKSPISGNIRKFHFPKYKKSFFLRKYKKFFQSEFFLGQNIRNFLGKNFWGLRLESMINFLILRLASSIFSIYKTFLQSGFFIFRA